MVENRSIHEDEPFRPPTKTVVVKRSRKTGDLEFLSLNTKTDSYFPGTTPSALLAPGTNPAEDIRDATIDKIFHETGLVLDDESLSFLANAKTFEDTQYRTNFYMAEVPSDAEIDLATDYDTFNWIPISYFDPTASNELAGLMAMKGTGLASYPQRSIAGRIEKTLARASRNDTREAFTDSLNSDFKHLSPQDLRAPGILSYKERQTVFEKYFGLVEDPKGFKHFAKCLRIAFDYSEKHRAVKFPQQLAAKFAIIHHENPTHAEGENFSRDFLNGFGLKDPESISQLREITMAAIAYAKIAQSKPDFQEEVAVLDSEIYERFNQNFQVGTAKPKKYAIDEIELSNYSSCPNAKTIYRIIDKLITKPDAEFRDITDILRFQLVLNSPADLNKVLRKLKGLYKNSKLEKKSSSRETRGKGVNESVVWLLGSYKGYPMEIRVVTSEDAYHNLQSEDRVHTLFELIKNRGVREFKMGEGIPAEVVEQELNRISKEPAVQSIVNTGKGKKELARRAATYRSPITIEQTKERLKQRIIQFYFPMGDKLMPYTEIFRLWRSPLLPNFNIIAESMFRQLNVRTGVKYSYEEWIDFFETSNRELLQNASKSPERSQRFWNVVSNLPGLNYLQRN